MHVVNYYSIPGFSLEILGSCERCRPTWGPGGNWAQVITRGSRRRRELSRNFLVSGDHPKNSPGKFSGAGALPESGSWGKLGAGARQGEWVLRENLSGEICESGLGGRLRGTPHRVGRGGRGPGPPLLVGPPYGSGWGPPDGAPGPPFNPGHGAPPGPPSPLAIRVSCAAWWRAIRRALSRCRPVSCRPERTHPA